MSAWRRIDRSDWPEIQIPDFGGVDRDGNPVMEAICPACGLYRSSDDGPEDHLDDVGPCPWAAARKVDG